MMGRVDAEKKMIAIRCPNELYNRIREVANARGMTGTAIVVQGIEFAVRVAEDHDGCLLPFILSSVASDNQEEK